MRVHLKLAGVKLDKKDVIGYSDPYFEVWVASAGSSAAAGGGAGEDSGETKLNFTLLHKSEVIKFTLNPVWKPVDLDLDASLPFFFKVYDWDRIGSHDFIGSTQETSVGDLLALPAYRLINPKKLPGGKKHKKGYVPNVVCYLVLPFFFLFVVAVGLQISGGGYCCVGGLRCAILGMMDSGSAQHK